jgi:hypothetical protein
VCLEAPPPPTHCALSNFAGKPGKTKSENRSSFNYVAHITSVLDSSLPLRLSHFSLLRLAPAFWETTRWFSGYKPHRHTSWGAGSEKLVRIAMSCLFVCFLTLQPSSSYVGCISVRWIYWP